MPKGRDDDDRCPDCGVFPRRIKTADGEARLCLNCSDDPVIAEVSALRKALDLDPRAGTCAFAFGLADALPTADEVVAETVFIEGVGMERPRIVAAACIYVGSILADDRLSQTAIAEAADISEVSIRKNYREFYDATGFAEAYGPVDRGAINDDDPHAAIDLEGWRGHLEAQDLSSDAVKSDVSNVRRFAVWYDGEGDPEPGDVAAWLAQLAADGYASRTIENRYDNLRRYFEWAGLGELKVRRKA